MFALLCSFMYGCFAYDLLRSDFSKLITLFGALFFLSYKLIRIYGWNFWLLAGMGVVFRLIFIAAFPNLSQDFYRFIWDGRLIAQGINPYLFTPAEYMDGLVAGVHISQAAELQAGMGALNAGHYTNYPPFNQFFFGIAGLLAGKSIFGSVVVMRIIIILADIGILYFGKKILELVKLPVYNIFWYFLNPFIIIELTGNLHFEGVMLFFMCWALFELFRRKWFVPGLLYGLSVSVKLIPLLFLPLFFRYFVHKGVFGKGFWKMKKFYWVVLLTIILSFLPFSSEEFLSNFFQTISLWFQDFEFNASIFYIIRWIGFETVGWDPIETAGKVLAGLVFLCVLAIAFLRKNASASHLIVVTLAAITIYLLLSTTVHPWYIATPLLLSVFTKYRFPIVWSAVVMLSYSAYGEAGFSENLWLVATEYCLLFGYMIWEIFFKSGSGGARVRSKIHQPAP